MHKTLLLMRLLKIDAFACSVVLRNVKSSRRNCILSAFSEEGLGNFDLPCHCISKIVQSPNLADGATCNPDSAPVLLVKSETRERREILLSKKEVKRQITIGNNAEVGSS